jgi:uncharacterized protein YidB (DUF937 family)
MTMALIGLLAYKALKHFGGQGAAPAGAGAGRPAALPPGGTVSAGNPSGGLGGILGGLLGGAAAGSVLSGGLGNLLKEFQSSGHGKAAQSWVGTGPNQEIAPKDLADALGGDTIDALSKQTGMGRDELLSGLSQQLPDLIDQLTPNGRLPTEEEASRMV